MRTLSIKTLVAGLIILIGCRRQAAIGRSQPAPENVTPYHLLLGFRGSVELRKQTWASYSPVSYGTAIGADDLLRLGTGATVTVACSDLSVLTLNAQPPETLPCPERGELVVHAHELLMRGATSPDCPAQILPRAGQLLDPRPVIRWAAVADTRYYHVDLTAGGMHWQRDLRILDGATEGSLQYPAEAPAIAPGSTVYITISGAGRSSSDCGPQRPALRLLSAMEQASVHRAEMRLASARLPAAELDFLRANLWLSHDLYAEAALLLERLVQAGHSEPAIKRLLGECYEFLELPDRAEQAYRAALSEAGTSQDLDTQAALEVALARVSTKPDEGNRLVQQAATLYRRLGDNQRAAELQDARN